MMENNNLQKQAEIQETLNEREVNYGKFQYNMELSWKLTIAAFMDFECHEVLESTCMLIFQKCARACNGNWYYVDNWHDVMGYVQLLIQDVEKQDYMWALSKFDEQNSDYYESCERVNNFALETISSYENNKGYASYVYSIFESIRNMLHDVHVLKCDNEDIIVPHVSDHPELRDIFIKHLTVIYNIASNLKAHSIEREEKYEN